MRMHRLRGFVVPFAVAGTVLLGVPVPAEAGRTVQCESEGGNRRTCNVGLSGRITLQRQLSRTACIEGQTWGAMNGEIWVSGGCRAEFQAGGGGWGGGGGSYGGTTVRCESQGGGRNYCGADTRGGVSLQRQLSRAACIQGQSWGYDGGGIWVDDGCRAEFHLGYQGYDGGSHHKKKSGNNTAAVAAGALVLGALIAVAASSGKKSKEAKASAVAAPETPAAEASSWAGIACRSAIQQKILDHYGEQAVVRFAASDGPSPEDGRLIVEGAATVENGGRTWDIAYRCALDEASRSVVEAHVVE